MTILIVDDNPMNLKLLCAILEGEGHEVLQASDGVEALVILEDRLADVVITDILMPNMDGFRLCQEIRKSERLRFIPVVIYTATYTSIDDEKLAIELGADRYIKKPAPLPLIRDTLLQVVRGRNASRRDAVDEQTAMRGYSEAIVRKLEQKNRALEEATTEIFKINSELEERVRVRTLELMVANEELGAFSYSAAHDLRAPLRAIGRYAQIVREDPDSHLSAAALSSLDRVSELTRKMAMLIDELLKLSNVGRCEIEQVPVDMSHLAESILIELSQTQPERKIDTRVEPGVVVKGDTMLLNTALENLLGNSWKFTRDARQPVIEFGREIIDGTPVMFVRDNGVGFDTSYANKLFAPFQRLHSQSEFPGTGLGLNIVQRIVARHGGRIWAESEPNKKTTFRFML